MPRNRQISRRAGLGGRLHKRCIVSPVRSRLPPLHPARWRRPQGERAAQPRDGEGAGGGSGLLSCWGRWGERPGCREEGERETEGGRGAGRLGERRGGRSQSEGGGRAGAGEGGEGGRLGAAGVVGESRVRGEAPREAGELGGGGAGGGGGNGVAGWGRKTQRGKKLGQEGMDPPSPPAVRRPKATPCPPARISWFQRLPPPPWTRAKGPHHRTWGHPHRIVLAPHPPSHPAPGVSDCEGNRPIPSPSGFPRAKVSLQPRFASLWPARDKNPTDSQLKASRLGPREPPTSLSRGGDLGTSARVLPCGRQDEIPEMGN